MLSNADITYVSDSFQVYGNNALTTCYNSAINTANCGSSNSEFSFEIRDALHNFSDHLPVTLSLEADVTLSNSNFEASKKITLESTLIDSELNIFKNSPEYLNQPLNIYNQLGQLVKKIQTNSHQKQTFNISNLSNGIYYIGFSDYNTSPLKFIVSH